MNYLLILGYTILVLGLGTVNIHHHLSLPNLNLHEIVKSNHLCLLGICSTYDIYLNDEIKGTDKYKELVKTLQKASYGDKVVFHLAGYGGDSQGMWDIINNIQNTKARTVMMVEAPVYSAHAYIAVSGDELHMDKYSFLMFHTGSYFGMDCTKVKGQDRGHPASEKACVMLASFEILTERYLDTVKYLTLEQKALILKGNDIYLFAPELNHVTLTSSKDTNVTYVDPN